MNIRILVVGVFAMMGASLADASPIIIPPDVAAGSIYYLAFVTAGTHEALSSNIADYDAFVAAEANLDPTLASLGTTWRVIGSTATVDAITHIGVTGPVYNLQGQQIATGLSDMFDGSLDAPINVDQFGTVTQYPPVWTGIDAYSGFYATERTGPLGSLTPWFGYDASTDEAWISAKEPAVQNTAQGALYGISGPLVAPTAVPEPASIVILGIGLAGLVVKARRPTNTRAR